MADKKSSTSRPRRLNPKQPEYWPLFSETFAEKKLAELHDPSNVCLVAERVAYLSLTRGVIDHMNNDGITEEGLKTLSDILLEGAKGLEARAEIVKLAHRSALVMGAYVLEDRDHQPDGCGDGAESGGIQ